MTSDSARFRKSIYFTMSFIVIIWLVKFIEYLFSVDLSEFGILPRTLNGSIGIFTAPFVHGDILHLLSNTFPILILGIGLFYFYDRIALSVITLIYIITGFWVWIAARDAYHIGASGLIYGLLAFLMLSGFLRKDTKSLAISFAVLFLYGTTFFSGMLPSQPGVSWESHLMGAIAGIFCAIYFKSSMASVPDNTISEESETAAPSYTYHYVDGERKRPKDNQQVHYHYTIKSNISHQEKKD